MEATPSIIKNFRNYVQRNVGICSYKYELSFKAGLAKIWGYMQVREQQEYFFSLINDLSQNFDKHNVKELDASFEVLLELLEHSSGKKTIFPHLPTVKMLLSDMPIQEPEFSIVHTFSKDQLTQLLFDLPKDERDIIRIGNKTKMLSVVFKDNKYTIYYPDEVMETVSVRSPHDASAKIFKLLNRYYDDSTNKLSLCVAVYKVPAKRSLQ
jgi:hypothetical protein